VRFSEKLRFLRLQNSLSQRALANALGFTHTHIQNLENGRSLPSADFVVRVARYFSIPTDVLLFDELDVRLDEQIVA
jgi:transcriptional regulator with XRE-family HTH domain